MRHGGSGSSQPRKGLPGVEGGVRGVPGCSGEARGGVRGCSGWRAGLSGCGSWGCPWARGGSRVGSGRGPESSQGSARPSWDAACGQCGAAGGSAGCGVEAPVKRPAPSLVSLGRRWSTCRLGSSPPPYTSQARTPRSAETVPGTQKAFSPECLTAHTVAPLTKGLTASEVAACWGSSVLGCRGAR